MFEEIFDELNEWQKELDVMYADDDVRYNMIEAFKDMLEDYADDYQSVCI